MHRLAGNLFALVTTGPEKCCHVLTDVCKLFIWMRFIVCFASLLLLLVCNLLPRIFLFQYEIVVSPSHTHHLTHTFSKYETNQHLQQFTMVHCTLVMKNKRMHMKNKMNHRILKPFFLFFCQIMNDCVIHPFLHSNTTLRNLAKLANLW